VVDKMPLKKLTGNEHVNRIGGVGSILVGLGCGVIAWMDYPQPSNMWKVWTFMAVLLIGNGIAMLMQARRVAKR